MKTTETSGDTVHKKNIPFSVYLDALGELLIDVKGDPALEISGAVADSRRAFAGCLFTAITGARDDGMRYVSDAVAAGARAVVAPEPLPPGCDAPVGFARVTDAYQAAARVAEVAAGWPARDLRLTGITGTNGKTTSAFLLQRIFQRVRENVGMIGTVHYEIGGRRIEADRTTPTPFQLQELFTELKEAKAEEVVLEVSSHALQQRRLGTAQLKGAIFTNLSGDHLDYHKTMDGYFAAKKIMFQEYLETGAPAVINVDDPHGRRLAEELAREAVVRVVTFGQDPAATWSMSAVQTSVAGSSMVLTGRPGSLEVKSQLIGLFNLYNVAGAACLALEYGMPAEEVLAAVAQFRGAPGRLEPVRSSNGITAFVDYAHTDDALINAAGTLAALPHRRFIIVFGCGGDRDKAKRPRMAAAAEKFADRIIVTDDNPRTEDPRAIIDDIVAGFEKADYSCVRDRRNALLQAVGEAQPGDVILVAGKGHETYQEVNGIKTDFDDCCEIRKAMTACGILTEVA